MPARGPPSTAAPGVLRFHETSHGRLATFTHGRTRVTRTTGFAECIVLSDSPVPVTDRGVYYEIVITETASTWTGGLEIGLIRALPASLTDARNVTDFAAQGVTLSSSGHVAGMETALWAPTPRTRGDRVGLLLDHSGRVQVRDKGPCPRRSRVATVGRGVCRPST